MTLSSAFFEDQNREVRLDNVGLVHMNGRVYDPQLGRFLSVDPVVADLRDSQSVNAYAYVGNRPLVATDPTGEFVQGIPYAGAIFVSIAQSIFSFSSHDSRPPPPSASALPGQSAQNGVSMCGPGTFSPTCGGAILYAGVPRPETGVAGTSTWGSTSPERERALENLDQLFLDLVNNTADELVIGTYRQAMEALDEATNGEFGSAAISTVGTLCDVVRPCKPLKTLTSAGGVTRRFIQSADRYFYRVYSSNKVGKWVTSSKPRSREWAQEALSLPPGNEATYVQRVRVPRGTPMERSRAAPMPEWNRNRGGAEQFEILEEIPPGNFDEGVLLP